MSFILRIENQYGRGPYYCVNLSPFSWIEGGTNGQHDETTGRPGPDTDFGDKWRFSDIPKNELYFGFQDETQLNNWFTEGEINRLKNYGYKVVRIPLEKIDIVFRSEKQVVFRYKHFL